MKTTKRRRGAILIAALLCLLVATMLGGALVQSVVAHDRQLRQQQRRAQAVWLTRSALQRGALEWSADTQYSGGTWNVPAEELPSAKGTSVQLTIERRDGGAELIVETRYPQDPFYGIVQRQRVALMPTEIRGNP